MSEVEKNKELTEKYPFLLPRNRFSDEVPAEYTFEYTELDDMPDGWRKAFGEQMCEEIKLALTKTNQLNKYRIIQIKEKYAELRWYDRGGNEETRNIIDKYATMSRYTCIECGAPATRITTGWFMPLCDKCETQMQTCSIEGFYGEKEHTMAEEESNG